MKELELKGAVSFPPKCLFWPVAYTLVLVPIEGLQAWRHGALGGAIRLGRQYPGVFPEPTGTKNLPGGAGNAGQCSPGAGPVCSNQLSDGRRLFCGWSIEARAMTGTGDVCSGMTICWPVPLPASHTVSNGAISTGIVTGRAQSVRFGLNHWIKISTPAHTSAGRAKC